MKKYTLKIESIQKETSDTVTLCFKQPGLRKIKYAPGQYLTLSLRINGRKFLRPYSFSSAPTTDSFLEITIKKVTGGVVSNYIHDHIQVGDLIEVMEPQGDFCYTHNNNDDKIYFWGVGSGITPLISIIKETLITFPALKIHLIYGSKNPESTIFLETINELIAKHPVAFNVTHFYTQAKIENKSNTNFHGRINKEYIFKLLKNNSFNSKHYICGPSGLKETIKETLKDLNIPASFVYSEDFELVKNPKDFENISDQNVRINFQESESEIRVKKGNSILEEAINLGLELPYSCQTGSCSTCKAKLIKGKIKMIGLDTPRLDLTENEFLLCCSYPLSNDVVVSL